MILYPAIDIMEGRAVRLRQGNFEDSTVYHGDPQHIAFLAQAAAVHSQSNPLHVDLWPSTTKLEAEIVAMTADRYVNAEREFEELLEDLAVRLGRTPQRRLAA